MKLPARIDFIGGWSDQLDYKGESAVINAAIGWDDQYPVTLTNGNVSSIIDGIGTGLGISSILEAGLFLQNNQSGDYIEHVLEYEIKQGTKGGWQDQIGGIEAGLKLITTMDHETFTLQPFNHAIMDHIVLFDTGIRRESKTTGDRMRALLTTTVGFRRDVADIVKLAKTLPDNEDPGDFAKACLSAWRELSFWLDCDIELPKSELVYGHKLCGAGAGGYGIMFVREREDRQAVIDWLETEGLWSRIPQLLDGIVHD